MAISDKVNEFIGRFREKSKKGLQDVVAVDFDPRGVVCVRMRKAGEEISVVGADILPPVEMSTGSEGTPEQIGSFSLPKNLIARYVAICMPGDESVVKLLSFPGELDSDAEARIRAHMGIEEGNYRISYRVVNRAHGRSETKLLTVALPEMQARVACAMFPVALPAPISIELAGLATMTAFLYGPGRDTSDVAVGIIEFGVRTTFLAFFSKGQLVLIRKFDFGTYHLLDTIQQSLGVDRETAQDIIADGSFDISQLIRDVSEPFVKQLVISKHFVERREDCHVARVFAPAGVSRDWLNDVKSALGVDVDSWDPFEGLNVLPNVLTDRLKGKLSRFSSAVGAALGTFEEMAG